MIRVAKRNTETIWGLHTKTGSWMFGLFSISRLANAYMSGAYRTSRPSYNRNVYKFYKNGVGIELPPKNPHRNGSRLVVSLALDTKLLAFELEGVPMHSVELAPADITDLFAAVDLRDANTSVSFL